MTETASAGQTQRGPRAGFWRRFAAAFIDGILLGVVNAILRVILGTGGTGLGLLVSLAYFTYLEGSESGQTIGKRTLGIRVSVGHVPGNLEALYGSNAVFGGYVYLLLRAPRQ